MFNSKVEDQRDVCVLNLDGELTTQHANELHTALVRSLDSVNHVKLNLEKVTDADLSCLQLFCSANLTFMKTGKRITVSNCSESFKQAVIDSGFTYEQGCVLECEDNCFNMKGDK